VGRRTLGLPSARRARRPYRGAVDGAGVRAGGSCWPVFGTFSGAAGHHARLYSRRHLLRSLGTGSAVAAIANFDPPPGCAIDRDERTDPGRLSGTGTWLAPRWAR